MTRPSPRLAAGATLALAAAAALALSAPLSASAHVSLEANTATPGTYDTLTFRVPNESTDGSTTTTITVDLPEDKGLLASVSYEPVAGWTAQLVTTKLKTPIVNGDDTTTEAVTQVVWTAADGQGLGAGALGLFKLYVGPIPRVGSITIPVDQGYSDGTVVSWSGAPDADHPAPVLYITTPPVTDSDADSAPETQVTATPTTTSAGSADQDVVSRVLGAVGVVLGAIALVVAIVGRRPRRAAPSGSSGAKREG